MYKPCAMRWNSVAAYRPSPPVMIMKPICAIVERVSAPLTSGFTNISTPAHKTVAAAAAIARADPAPPGRISGASRISSTPPAFTTPACSSAETGVGAASVQGSQPGSGSCADRDRAASTSRQLIAVTVTGCPASGARSGWRNVMAPHRAPARITASHSAPSPTRNARAVLDCPSRAAGRCR